MFLKIYSSKFTSSESAPTVVSVFTQRACFVYTQVNAPLWDCEFRKGSLAMSRQFSANIEYLHQIVSTVLFINTFLCLQYAQPRYRCSIASYRHS